MIVLSDTAQNCKAASGRLCRCRKAQVVLAICLAVSLVFCAVPVWVGHSPALGYTEQEWSRLGSSYEVSSILCFCFCLTNVVVYDVYRDCCKPSDLQTKCCPAVQRRVLCRQSHVPVREPFAVPVTFVVYAHRYSTVCLNQGPLAGLCLHLNAAPVYCIIGSLQNACTADHSSQHSVLLSQQAVPAGNRLITLCASSGEARPEIPDVLVNWHHDVHLRIQLLNMSDPSNDVKLEMASAQVTPCSNIAVSVVFRVMVTHLMHH